MNFEGGFSSKQVHPQTYPTFASNMQNRSLPQSMQPVLDALQPLFVRNFLFKGNSFHLQRHKPLSPLEPYQNDFAQADQGQSSATLESPLVTFTDPILSKYYWALRPESVVGPFAFGIGDLLLYPQGQERRSALSPINVRFIRNMLTRTLLIAMDLVGENCFFLFCTRLESTKTSSSCRVSFDGSIREASLQDADTIQLQHIQHCITAVRDEVYQRSCVFCESQFVCECSFPPINPQEPFELRSFWKEMGYHCVDVAEFEVGMPVLACGIGCTKSLLQSTLSSKTNLNNVPSTCEESLPNNNIETSLSRIRLSDDALTHAVASAAQGVQTIPVHNVNMMFSGVTPNEVDRAQLNNLDALATSWLNGFRSAENGSLSFLQEADDNLRVEMNDMNLSLSEDNGVEPSVHEEKRKILHVERDEKRRKRNRESAKRSNEKKKQKKESLIAQIEHNKAKIGVLRQRELDLRKDNKTLKDLFQGIKSRES